MALSQHLVNVVTKSGSVRSHGRATWDSSEVAADLVAAYVEAPTSDHLRQSGASARARIASGVVTVEVDAPIGAGVVPVVVTIDA